LDTTNFEPLLAAALRLADADPGALLYSWADDRGRIVEQVTRREALARAARVAEDLRASGRYQPGDRVLLVYPPGLAFVWALLGAMAAGLVPVPVYPPHPAKGAEDIERLARIAADAGCRAALTDRSFRWVVRWLQVKGLLLGTRMPPLDWVVTGAAQSSHPLLPVRREPGDVAVLQYTSGSTGDPRGVAITWANLDHQLRLTRESLGLTAASRSMAWVPQYHDLGLISGILSAASGNGSLLLASPFAFLRRPALWFDLITEIRATHTAAPNFAYGLLLRRSTPEERARWRLDSLEIVMSAAEPIDAGLMARFLDEMAPHGLRPGAFCPAYGLAEHTVGVSMNGRARVDCDRDALEREAVVRPARPDRTRATLVGCGAPARGVAVKIVNPEGHEPVPAGHVGEIWVRSGSVAAGYHGRAEETRATFGARLAGGDGPWLRTGDLGCLCEGEIVVTGRLKDLIICGGRNLYPQDLEATVMAAHASVRPGCVAAFALTGRDTDAVGMVVEVREGADVGAVVAAVRQAVRHHHGIGIASLTLGRPGLVKKTTSGKLRRRATAAALADGSLARSPAWIVAFHEEPEGAEAAVDGADDALARAVREIRALPAERRHDAMVAALCAAAAALSGREALAPDRSFQEQGLESLAAVELVARLESALGMRLAVEQLAVHPTPQRLARFLLDGLGLAYEAPATATGAGVEAAPWPVWRRPTPAGSRVAIVGAGVAGLVAAHELARLGYRDVTLFEAEDAPGGKVRSVTVDGVTCELGGTFFSEASQLLLGLAQELDLPFSPAFGVSVLATEAGDAQPDAPTVTDRWLDRIFAAAGGPVAEAWTAGFGYRDPALAQPMRSWLEAHGVDAIPFDISMLWTAYGYGYFDEEVPAHLLVEYQRHARHRSRTPVRIDGGNQRLWRALAERLTGAGMTIHYATPVTRLEPSEGGVVVTAGGAGERFDEVVLACEPAVAARMLPAGDALGARLARFRTLPYLVHIARVTGMRPGVAAVTAERGFARAHSGSVLGLIRQDATSDLVSVSQYAVDAQGAPLPDDVLAATLAADLAAMGLGLVEVRATKLWSFFPAVRPEHAGTWLELQALQGDRGLWIAGGAVSFEAMEHTARHARALMRLGFGPGPATRDALLAEPPPSTVVAAGPPVPAPLGTQWALELLESGASTHNTHVGAVALLEGIADPARVQEAVAHLDATLDGLRVGFRRDPGGPLAFLRDTPPPAPELRDLGALEAPEAALRAWARQAFTEPFRPDDARLYRVGIARLGGDRLGLWLVAHHAIVDADGFGALSLQLARTLAQGCPARVPSDRPSVLDEALSAELARAPHLAAALAFWEARLATLASQARHDTRTAGPMIERVLPLDRSVARRLQLAAQRQGWPMVTFLAAAAGRVAAARSGGADRCLGLVTAHRSGDLVGPKPSRLVILPLGLEGLPDAELGYLTGCRGRLDDVVQNLVDGPALLELQREAGLEASPWAWTVNHFELPSRWPVGAGAMRLEPLTSGITRRPLELATMVDPATGAMSLRLHARAADLDEAALDDVARALLEELERLAAPALLWQLPGIGLCG
jgi:acyl-CoA synthetase (AMP-forming)/AMP-acid ligase II/acyl carrier protein